MIFFTFCFLLITTIFLSHPKSLSCCTYCTVWESYGTVRRGIKSRISTCNTWLMSTVTELAYSCNNLTANKTMAFLCHRSACVRPLSRKSLYLENYGALICGKACTTRRMQCSTVHILLLTVILPGQTATLISDWLVGWLNNWLTDWLNEWMNEWLIDWLLCFCVLRRTT